MDPREGYFRARRLVAECHKTVLKSTNVSARYVLTVCVKGFWDYPLGPIQIENLNYLSGFETMIIPCGRYFLGFDFWGLK